MCRDGLVYGCGSTEFGQLPYLRHSLGAGQSDGDDDAPARGEITVPTRLRLQFLQAGPAVSIIIPTASAAASCGSIFLSCWLHACCSLQLPMPENCASTVLACYMHANARCSPL